MAIDPVTIARLVLMLGKVIQAKLETDPKLDAILTKMEQMVAENRNPNPSEWDELIASIDAHSDSIENA